MKPITREWLNAAYDDILAMQSMLGVEGITNIVAFHAQQCIEKSFKALIEEFDLGKVKTHQLESLYAKILHLQTGFNESIIAELDSIYIEARYPGEMGLMPNGKPTTKEAENYYLEALRIKNAIEDYLNQKKD